MSTTTMTPARVEFDVDAMLMYGWMADCDGNVRGVSNSLQRWIRDHSRHAPEANVLLNGITNDGAVPLAEFLRALLDPETEAGTPELVARYMERLEESVTTGGHTRRLPEREGEYRIALQYQPASRGARPLAGARFLRDGATLLVSRQNAERVDIVVVAVVEECGSGWRVKGYQGQLQEAWLRVSNRVVDGNRAGGIALMARNLSHNIGSHALYWIASGMSKDERNFLNYLQVRMELLAGFATSMPLSPVPGEISAVVQRFAESTLLLNNICRSESVARINIQYSGGEHKAVFFGGEIGVHALYSIFENCMRDSAKFAPRRASGNDTLTMHIHATSLEDFVQIDVYDNSCNFDEHGPAIQRALEQIKISDESGKLVPSNWGIKERFVCAAILRGDRPEDFPQQETAAPDMAWLGELKPGGKRILELVRIDGNCAWRFYLPRRQTDVLLVTDRTVDVLSEGGNVLTFSEFETAVKSPTAITAPFVVLDGLPQKPEARVLEASLPYRTFVRGNSGDDRFAHIDMPLEAISPTALLRQNVEKLMTTPTRLVLAVGENEQAAGTDLSFDQEFEDPRLVVINDTEVQQKREWLGKKYPGERFILIKRHHDQSYLNLIKNATGFDHVEAYDNNGALYAAVMDVKHDRVRACYRLLEAALTTITILDERLDLSLHDDREDLMRKRLRLKGIEVQGKEFAGHATKSQPPSPAEVAGWVAKRHIVMLHRGILEKLCRGHDDADTVVQQLEANGARVIIHSGRMGMSDMPPHTKFLSLSSVTTWIEHEHSKLQIIDELFSLRRV